jgi:hypothetical protein
VIKFFLFCFILELLLLLSFLVLKELKPIKFEFLSPTSEKLISDIFCLVDDNFLIKS